MAMKGKEARQTRGRKYTPLKAKIEPPSMCTITLADKYKPKPIPLLIELILSIEISIAHVDTVI